METTKDTELQKKKEEIVKYQEWKISDQMQNFREENTKTNVMFVLSGILLAALFQDNYTSCIYKPILVLISLAVFIGIYNFHSKKVDYHINEENRFNSDKMSYAEYLEHKFKSLVKSYDKINEVFKEKIELNKISFILLASSFIFFIFI